MFGNLKTIDWSALNMKNFKAKHNKKYYKDVDAWLNAVYRNNKETIMSGLADESGVPRKNTKATFKAMVKEFMKEGLSPTKAVKTIARSTLFTSDAERIRLNAYGSLTKDKSVYKAFREYTKEKGRYTKFDEGKMVWDKSQGIYIYNNRVTIDFKNSPYGIIVRRI